jgi:hypothetical protein
MCKEAHAPLAANTISAHLQQEQHQQPVAARKQLQTAMAHLWPAALVAGHAVSCLAHSAGLQLQGKHALHML